ncbi:membrane bound O-acyl transferase family-domain-containing protein [Apiospora arundinis]
MALDSTPLSYTNGPVATIIIAILFVAGFNAYTLVTAPNSRARVGGVLVLAGLTGAFQASLRGWCANKGYVSLLVTTAWTICWHAVEMLLVSKVSAADIEELARKHYSKSGASPTKRWQLFVCTSSLLCKWRRIGTKWQIPNPPRFSPDGSVPSRAKFLVRSMLKIAGSYLMMSMFSVAPPPDPNLIAIENQQFFSRLGDISSEEAIFRVVSTAVFFINVALMVTMWYYLICVSSVVLGLANPEDCPPFYGSLWNAYTLRGLWRNIHQGLRKCVSGPADAFTDSILRLPRGTFASRCTRLILAFGISALIHAQADVANDIPFSEAGQFTFFSIQALAIIVESAVQEICTRTGVAALLPQSLQRGLGFLWVISWFCWITPTWSFMMMRSMDPVKDGIVMPAHYLAKWFQ